jgi:hypothetical protein
VSDLFPFDLSALVGGPVRVVLAPTSVALPAHLDDIFAQTKADSYALADDWIEVGATGGATQASRNITTSGWKIEQSTSQVLKKVTETARTVQVPFAELRPDILNVIENGPGAATEAAATGRSAAVKVPFGAVTELEEFRLAFIALRSKSQGEVIEGTGGPHRGRFLAYVAYRATPASDNVQVQFEDGNMSVASMTFDLTVDDAAADGGEHGYWLSETAGTIVLT